MSDVFIHESSYVDEGARIGEGTKIWHFSHVMSQASIGENCTIGQNVFIASGTVIGDNVKLQNNVSIYKGVIIEDNVFLGPSCVFTNVINPRGHVERKQKYESTIIRQGATIGANATIICGVTLGRYAFVGAGSVVSKDVPDYALVFGNPARLQGWMCQCGNKIEFVNMDEKETTQCSDCGMTYEKDGQHVGPNSDSS